MNLRPFTRQVEKCRRRWNRRTLQYVVAVAKIVKKAKVAAGNRRRWIRWVQKELRMNRSTVHRYIKVEEYLNRNVALMQHFEKLTVVKVYALSRLETDRAAQILKNPGSAKMNDAAFVSMLRRWIPMKPRRLNPQNLLSSMTAAITRIEKSLKRWREGALIMSHATRVLFQNRLSAAEKALHRIARSAAAM